MGVTQQLEIQGKGVFSICYVCNKQSNFVNAGKTGANTRHILYYRAQKCLELVHNAA